MTMSGTRVVVTLACAMLAATAVLAARAIGQTSSSSEIERGAYLASVGACGDCHTPFKMGPNGPEPDETLTFSGHPAGLSMPQAPTLPPPWTWAGAATNTAFAGPWGVSYAINLTPDRDTGLGLWTEKMFVDAMRTGKHAGVGRPILPPMPWPHYAKMTDVDLKALLVYLRSVKPIRNQVPQPVIAPPPK